MRSSAYSVEPLEQFALLPVHPWSAPCIIPGTSEMPRRKAQRIRYRKFGKGLARLRRGESQTQPNQRSLYAPQTCARQGRNGFLFSWLNTNSIAKPGNNEENQFDADLFLPHMVFFMRYFVFCADYFPAACSSYPKCPTKWHGSGSNYLGHPDDLAASL
ncbi:hypothetical protein EOD23_16310 [Mesorhizobium sp. USDA-HM6]|nr:hypothetical protein EOD23_16310 [Mesorhizobium sp. USDA-HM6]